jgi:hypothetical protein
MKTQFGASCLTILTALGLAACSGQIGDDTVGGAPGEGPSTVVTDPKTGMPVTLQPGEMLVNGKVCKSAASFSSARMMVITDEQYVNIVRDVFGYTFMGDVTGGKDMSGEYKFNAAELAQVSTASAEAYMRAADQVASNIKPCGASTVNATCMKDYLTQKLPLAWRRPVTSAEIDGLMTIFNGGVQDSTARAVQLTMEAALGSEAFLYRHEVGNYMAGMTGTVTLTGPELAAAVGIALTNSAPDAELAAKGQDGSITQLTVLTSEVDRLMATPAARANLKRKVSYYLNFEKIPIITKDQMAYKEFSPALQATLYQSSQKFLDDILWTGKFSDLFTNTSIYADATIASVYKLPNVTGTQLVKVDGKAAGYSAGILTHPGLLASSNIHAGTDDIVHRGLWVYNNLVCGISIGVPPANADSVFATLMGTPRQKALARDKLSCGACHGSFDPFGLVTESFDPIGRFRTVDPDPAAMGGAIETSATINVTDADDINGPVANVNELGTKLASGRRATDCATVYLSKFMLDHNPDVENSCMIEQVKDNFSKTGSFTDLFKALLTSPAFLTRDL